VISVGDHDGAESETHHQQGQRLQAVEIAQVVPPG
jgi:hypothetical protein